MPKEYGEGLLAARLLGLDVSAPFFETGPKWYAPRRMFDKFLPFVPNADGSETTQELANLMAGTSGWSTQAALSKLVDDPTFDSGWRLVVDVPSEAFTLGADVSNWQWRGIYRKVGNLCYATGFCKWLSGVVSSSATGATGVATPFTYPGDPMEHNLGGTVSAVIPASVTGTTALNVMTTNAQFRTQMWTSSLSRTDQGQLTYLTQGQWYSDNSLLPNWSIFPPPAVWPGIPCDPMNYGAAL